MSQKTTPLRIIFLIRHGATKWSESGQHTGLTNLELTQKGQDQARELKKRLRQYSFDQVFCSALKRAEQTCNLCGLTPQIDPDLNEWNYGKYEGLTTEQIRGENPNWDLFRDGAPSGETPAQVIQRAQNVLRRLEVVKGTCALFSSAHFLRVLATQWLEVDISMGKHLPLSPASISVLGYEHKAPAILVWNDGWNDIAKLSIK